MHFSYTLLLIIVTVASSLYAYENRSLFEKLSFKPYAVAFSAKEYHRFISHAFVHADLLHLMFNMMVLYWFGEPLEKYFGMAYGAKGLYFFVLLYFGGALFCCLPSLAKHRRNPYYSAVGASGATSALVFAYIALAPTSQFGFIFLPGIQLPAIVYGVIILVAEYYLSKRGGTNIAHDAHIYGSFFGFVFVFLIDKDNFWSFLEKIQHWG